MAGFCPLDKLHTAVSYPHMTHPYSIYIWQPPLSSTGEGRWIEPLQAYTQEYALYAANLIRQDTRAVIKVVRYGFNLACFPNEHAVELVERQIARQRERIENEESPND
jgi:hypothetical protein